MKDFAKRWLVRGGVTLGLELGMVVLVFSTVGFMHGIILSVLFALADTVYVVFEEDRVLCSKIHNEAMAALEKAKLRPEHLMARNRGWFITDEKGRYCLETILNKAALDVAKLEDRISKLESAGK